MTNLDSIFKSRDITLPTKVHLVKAMVFPSSHVWMWELDYKESWVPKNWCFWTVVLEKPLESPLDYKEIQPVHPKGISPEYSLEGLMLRLKLQYLGHLMWRTDSFEKTLMLGKIEGGRRRGQQRIWWVDGITWCHVQLDGHEFEQAPGVDDERGSLVCCSPGGCKEWDTTEQLNWTYRMKTIKNANIWRLNNTLLNNQQITKEIKKENMHRNEWKLKHIKNKTYGIQ